MAEPPAKDTVSVTGIVIPVDWSADGSVKAVALADFNERLHHLEPGALANSLFRLVQREVTVTGRIIERGGKKMIEVSKFKQTKTVGGKLLTLAVAGAVSLGLMAGGAFAAEQAAPAAAPKVVKEAAKPAPKAAVKHAKKTKKAKKSAAKKTVKKSAEVAKLQGALAKAGYKLKADGLMGKHTRAALKAFQKKNGLKVTGKADAATKKALSL